MSLFSILTSLLVGSLVIRAAFFPLSGREKIFLGLFLLLYLDLILILYLWIPTPQEVQIITYLLFGTGTFWFVSDILALFFKKDSFLSQNLKLFKKHHEGPYQEIILACQILAEAGLGALMILERKQSLTSWCQKGILIDAKISKELIHSLFTPPGTLHDGAVIFQKDRIISGAVIVPLNSHTTLSKDLGTRHRAAVGFSEMTDGLCLVISEETGSISIADRGILNYNIPFSLLAEALERGLRFKRQKRKIGAPLRQPAEV